MGKITEHAPKDICARQYYDDWGVSISLEPEIKNFLQTAIFIKPKFHLSLLGELSNWLNNHHQFTVTIPNEGMEYLYIFTSGYSIAIEGASILAIYMVCPGWNSYIVYLNDDDVYKIIQAITECRGK